MQAVAAGRNVVSISKPGTGKTTVAIAASKLSRKFGKALHLTYNKNLKEESRERVKQLGLEADIDVDSYHAAATRLFCGVDELTSPDETLIYAAIAAEPCAPIDYGLLVVDEAQDLTPLFVEFILHLLRHFVRPPIMLIIGDPFQRIFGYRGASWEFMMDPVRYFGPLLASSSFIELHLSVCWRITPEMAAWINENLDPRNLVHSVSADWWERHSELIVRWWGDGVKAAKKPRPGSVVLLREGVDPLFDVLRTHMQDFDPGDRAFLTRSVVYPPFVMTSIIDSFPSTDWYVTNAASAWETSSEAPQHKTTATTIHRFKGLERAFICVVGLDARWESADSDPLEVFSLLFVACTRATQQLVVIQGKCVPYATIRRTVRAGVERPKTAAKVCTLLQHTSFDGPLCISRSSSEAGLLDTTLELAIGGISNDVMDAGRVVNGRRGIEDVSCFLDDTIVAGVVSEIQGRYLQGKLSELLQSRKKLPKNIVQWLESQRGVEVWTLEQMFTLIVAENCLQYRYSHQWRQVKASASLLSVLDKCVSNTRSLLATAAGMFGKAFDVLEEKVTKRIVWSMPWFRERHECYLTLQEGCPRFAAFDDTRIALLHVVTAPILKHETVVFVSACAAFLSLFHNKPCQAMIIVANQGKLFCVHRHCSDFELLYRISARKLGHAIQEDEIRLAEEERANASFF